jgi:hypothetical protein
MKTIIPWVILLALTALFVADHFNGKADLAKMEEAYQEKKAADAKVIAGLRADIEMRDENIGQLNGELDSNAMVIEALKKKAVDAEAGLVAARKGWKEFSLEAQAKLHELDNAWSAKFSLAQEEIKKWEGREVIWKAKEVEYQAKVSDLEAIVVAKDRTNAACEATQKDIAKALIRERRASRLKNWIAGGVGVLGYALGKA